MSIAKPSSKSPLLLVFLPVLAVSPSCGSLQVGPFRQKLISVASNTRVDSWQLRDADLGHGAGSWSVTKRTLRGGLQEGVDVVEVDNGTLRFSVIPTRGMSIGEVHCGSVRLL